MTEVTRDSLQRRYADLVDAELLRRLHSGMLTELAHEVATAEAQARGLSLEPPAAAPGAPIPEAIDFAPDEFERNPYQAPRIAAHSAAPPAARFGFWDVLWFVYAGLFMLLAATAVVFAANPLDPETLIELAASGFALVGILAWRLRRRWLNPTAWVACLAINLAWLAAMLREAWVAMRGDPSSDLMPLFLTGVVMMTALHLPLLWGVARYAFFSRSIWHRDAPRSEPERA